MKAISITITLICLILVFASISNCAQPLPAPSPSPTPTPTPQPTPSPIPSPPIEEYTIELAERFCPIIHLNNEVDNNEYFEPDPVELIVDLSILRDVYDPTFIEKPAIDDLGRWSRSAYYLDIANLEPKPESIDQYKNVYDSVKNQYEPTIYARVMESEGEDHTIIQYWLFYYLNDWRNVHEGDWELIQLHFNGLSTQNLLSQQEEPIFTAYSQHQGGQKMSWAEMKNRGLIRDTHPLVYVAKGSHANYFAPGQFWSGLDFDDTGLSSWRVIEPEQLNVVVVREDESIEWLGFQGRWGEYLGLFISFLDLRFGQQGPFGPQWDEGGKQSQKWQQPQDWAAGLPEYPKPFWTSFIKLPGDWSELAVFSVFSPADLHVYDSTGRHIGLDETGELEIQIQGAMYIVPEGTDYKTILVPDADIGNEYRMEIKGTDSGMMDIRAQIPDVQAGIRRFLEYLKVPVTLKTIARAVIKPEELMLAPRLAPRPGVAPAETTRDMTTKLEIDSNGDGFFEMESIPGRFEEKRVEKSPPIVPEQTTSPTPTPTPPVIYSIPDLKYLLLSNFENVFYVDPDFYPVAREGQEEKNALEQFPAIKADITEFSAILKHLGLPNKAEYTNEEKLLIYREYKKLTLAVEMTTSGDTYHFILRVGESQGERVEGNITPSGKIEVLKREPSFNTYPICLTKGTLIDTPSGSVPVEQLHKGMAVWTVDDSGKRIIGTVAKTTMASVPLSFKVVTVRLNDRRTVTTSPGHPTAERRAIGNYNVGDILDGALVISVEHVIYNDGATYDLLPTGATGLYWANEILLKSTIAIN